MASEAPKPTSRVSFAPSAVPVVPSTTVAEPPTNVDNQPPPSVVDEPEARPSKTKTKPPKKKKLTKAERKALKLAEALAFKKLEFRDSLRRELELSKKSARRGREAWEDMCKEVKIREFREELHTWDAKTQRVLQQKDDKITMLLEDMGTTQEMHRRHFARQLLVMDYMIKSYKTMLDTSRALYESQAAEILNDFYEELNEKEDTEEHIKINCENVMHATNLIVEQQMLRDYQIYLEKRDDAVNTEIERRYRMRDAVVAKMQDLRKQLLDFVHVLQDSSLDVHKNERIRLLMERQRNFVVETKKLNDVELQSTRTCADLQRELLHIDLESQRQLNDLRLEMAYFIQVRKTIEVNIELDRKITFEKLKILCRECFDVVKQLKRLEKCGELLLCLAASCRKMQTESEKVVPWGDFQEPQHKDDEMQLENISDNEQYFKLQVLDLKSHFDLSEKELLDQMALMRNFWRRQALVEAQNLLLKKEKFTLIAENEKYTNFIKSMSKTDNVDELLEAVTVKSVMVTQPHCQQKYRLAQQQKARKWEATKQAPQDFADLQLP